MPRASIVCGSPADLWALVDAAPAVRRDRRASVEAKRRTRRKAAFVSFNSALIQRAVAWVPADAVPALTLNRGSRWSPSRNRQALPLGNAHRFTDGLEATSP